METKEFKIICLIKFTKIQKEIKRWKRYTIVSIAISATLLAACIGGSIYVRYFIIEEKSNNTEAQTTQIVQQETDEDSEQIGRPKGIISEFYRSVRCSEDGKIYLKLKCVLVQDSAETQMTGLVKNDESIQKRIIIQGMEGSEKSRTDGVFI